MTRPIIFSLLLPLLLAVFAVNNAAATEATITVDKSTAYQTITGWESVAQGGQDGGPGHLEAFEKYGPRLVELLVDGLGINRVRLPYTTGAENPRDRFTPFITGEIDEKEWRSTWFESINDNDDPRVIDWKGFQFSRVDLWVEKMIIPMRERLRARSERIHVNLTVVDFRCCEGARDLWHRDEPEEYAEFILALFMHMKEKYGFVPDTVEVILEPDNARWSGIKIGRNMVAAGNRLKEHGFTPGFIGPSNTNMRKAITWFELMVQVPGVTDYLTEYAYHRYHEVTPENLAQIVKGARKYGLRTSMLELLTADEETLHEDLEYGMVSAWTRMGAAFQKDDVNNYFILDLKDPADPKVIMPTRTYLLRQYFLRVRSGATRINAKSDEKRFSPLAFINTDNTFVVVVKADEGGAFMVSGLPAGSYGVYYTTEDESGVELDPISIADNEAVTAAIPSKGVITVYGIAADKGPRPVQ